MRRPANLPLPANIRYRSSIRRALRDRGFDDFETFASVSKQQASMMRRHKGNDKCKWEAIGYCRQDDICRVPKRCQAACLIGNWAYRSEIIVAVHDKIKEVPREAFLVTVVLESWSFQLGRLADLKPATPHRWIQGRLQNLKGVRGIAYVDVSFNTMGANSVWQGHLHAVLTGATKEELKAALSVKANAAVPKPVMVKEIADGDLVHVLAYATKPLPEGRVAYVAENGRQAQRFINVPPKHLREHDLWRMGMLMPDRHQLIGMRIG
ncbi:hypothetical protein [Xanthobacter sp. VNH20]|uniref:hypothetical protein n=1 Tax=Xanthobacter sp. VNH20 TaxID=3156616 RepID=UPI0032B43535